MLPQQKLVDHFEHVYTVVYNQTKYPVLVQLPFDSRDTLEDLGKSWMLVLRCAHLRQKHKDWLRHRPSLGTVLKQRMCQCMSVCQ